MTADDCLRVSSAHNDGQVFRMICCLLLLLDEFRCASAARVLPANVHVPLPVGKTIQRVHISEP